jgi:cold shock protein|uniref:CSD domain-containing protein n=1 Tax=viral metagenome TaxID=1070528 RepID=A0A6C0ISQ9_9ZZZZ
MSSTVDTATAALIGKVKWFNNKAGYGFITLKEGEEFRDIFVHYSAIRVTNSQYKYLVQGEYIQFDLEKSADGPHEVKAINVTGVTGGELMCETRHSIRPRRSGSNDGFTQVKTKRTVRTNTD